MKRAVFLALTALLLLELFACGAREPSREESGSGAPSGRPTPSPAPTQAAAEPAPNASEDPEEKEETSPMKMNVQVGAQTFTATLADNAGVRALVDMLREGPVTLEMSDYAGFEKVGPLGRTLPTEDRETATVPGDVVLYCGDKLVLFYGENAWSYTPIGHIDDLTGWAEALGSGNVTAVLTLPEK